MSDERQRMRSIPMPASDFDDLKCMLEQLTQIEKWIQMNSHNLRSMTIRSIEGTARLDLRSEVNVSHDGIMYKSLIVAVIAFRPERKGIGTKVMEWLKNYAIYKGFDRICIENAHTEASVGFAHKLGFSDVPLSPLMSKIVSQSIDYHLLLHGSIDVAVRNDKEKRMEGLKEMGWTKELATKLKKESKKASKEFGIRPRLKNHTNK